MPSTRLALTGLSILVALLFGLSLLASPSSCQGGQMQTAEPETGFRPVASVAALMSGHGQAFDNIRQLMPAIELPERNPSIATWAELLAELGNVNTLHGRKQEYKDMAAESRELALALAEEARKPDASEERLGELFGLMDGSCAQCHEVFQ